MEEQGYLSDEEVIEPLLPEEITNSNSFFILSLFCSMES